MAKYEEILQRILADPAAHKALRKRFWRQVACIDSALDTCWHWLGAQRQRKRGHGYGVITIGPRQRQTVIAVHRLSYLLEIGPIPQGLVLDHLCRNPACVNPRHLEPVTNGLNVLRGSGLTARHARKTHCIHGHPFDAANTWLRSIHGKKQRECRQCWLDRRPAYNARARARRAARRPTRIHEDKDHAVV